MIPLFPVISWVIEIESLKGCITNSSVQGQVCSSQKRFWTQPVDLAIDGVQNLFPELNTANLTIGGVQNLFLELDTANLTVRGVQNLFLELEL